MQYNQPYGVTDLNAPYINGNPSTGTMGSIPPAASIEFPQREIVNLILAANLATPSNADLVQLAKAIQSQRLNFSTDYGTANAYVAKLQPAPDDYYTGMVCRLQVGQTNAGDSTLALYPLAPKHIVRPDGTNLQQYDLLEGAVPTFVYVDTHWVLTGSGGGGTGGGGGGPIYLAAPLDYYVNGATGDDTFDGSQAAVGTAPKGPFKTLQRASNAVAKFNLNGFNVTVHVADYNAYAGVKLPAVAGQGTVLWQGNSAHPENCVVNCGNDPNVSACFGMAGLSNVVDGFKLLGTAGPLGSGIGGGGGQLVIQNIEWGQCNGTHCGINSGAYLRFGGLASDGTIFRVSGSALGNQYVPGCFLYVESAAHADTENLGSPPAITITGPVSYQFSFMMAADVGVMEVIFSAFNGAGNVTGQKYNARTNAVINTGGGGASYYPGNTAGAISSGGQYI